MQNQQKYKGISFVFWYFRLTKMKVKMVEMCQQFIGVKRHIRK